MTPNITKSARLQTLHGQIAQAYHDLDAAKALHQRLQETTNGREGGTTDIVFGTGNRAPSSLFVPVNLAEELLKGAVRLAKEKIAKLRVKIRELEDETPSHEL